MKIWALFLILSLPLASSASPRFLNVSFEKQSYYKTGGLGIAPEGLTTTANQMGFNMDFIMPYYTHMTVTPIHMRYVGDVQVPESFSKLQTDTEHGRVFFMKHNASMHENYFYNPAGGYGPKESLGLAVAAFCRAVANDIIANPNKYNVVILNDWHTALIALYLDMAKKEGKTVPKVVFILHNTEHKGEFSRDQLGKMGIPESYFTWDKGIEYHGQINFLKAARFADERRAVSEVYAEEVKTARSGSGMHGFWSEVGISGFPNGIINEEWDPTKKYFEDTITFSTEDLSGKLKGKLHLQKKLGLSVNADIPVVVLTSRLAEQKGYEYLIPALEAAVPRMEAQFIVTGDKIAPSEQKYLDAILNLQKKYPHKFYYEKFSDRFEKDVLSYGDFFLGASWFEPSGLNQFFAKRMGTIPILTRVGGLATSIVDGITGFHFNIAWSSEKYDIKETKEASLLALERALRAYKENPELIKSMRIRNMKEDHSWSKRVIEYFMPLVEKVTGRRLGNGPGANMCRAHFLN